MDSTMLRPAEDVAGFLAHLRASPPGPYRKGPVRHLRRDGSQIWVDITAHEIPFEGRKARLVLINDVTSKLAAEAEARLLARAFESSKSGMLIADALSPDFPTVYVNPAFVRMSGYAESEILGSNCRFMQGEARFHMVEQQNPGRYKHLLSAAERDVRERYAYYEGLARLGPPKP